ncbi:MAG TPA: transglycosylase SLT domain-containing protein [Gemmatimonadaceae bacterium]|jgi:membrane-bound lytic murein transglycosylase D|nr:transglycosylase SLT domain-containing protein [Gemmatimonadaceae bacterium]
MSKCLHSARVAAGLGLAGLVGACGGHARPAPTPAPSAPAGGPTTGVPAPPQAKSDTAGAKRDTVTRAEVVGQAASVFGDSLARDSAKLAMAADTARTSADSAVVTWDIDVRSYETQRRVARFVALFAGESRDHFQEQVERGTRYEPMIRAKLRAAGLPEDMTYLALIESGYSPQAYSRAAAVGMWQLMTSTAQGAGLRVDWWVDERRDPVRSTDAAIKFLRYLKDQFGSLYLAAAAYNGGPGRISRGLTRYADDLEGQSGDDLFFALADKDYLRDETKNYVPQLIAAALVAKEPTRYGLHITALEPYTYDSVRVGPATPLAAVAKACNATTTAVGELNPFILRGMTPPKDSFTVRVPPGHADGFDSAFAALPKSERVSYTKVVSKKGETMATVAHRAGITAKELGWYNPKAPHSKSGRLPLGTPLLVPTSVALAGAVDVPDPSIERYGTGGGIHIVKRGESLGLIAKHYHTSVAALMRLNGLRKSTILPGQALVVSGTRRVAHKHHHPQT